jgi:hypothetical protein
MNQTDTPPDNWQELVPQNRQGHWCISDSGCRSEPFKNDKGNWAVVIWNRREECHYEIELNSGKMKWHRYPWDNQWGLYYTHKNEIVDLVPRLVKDYQKS